MPLGGAKLSADVIEAFEQWVRMGAPDPREAPLAAPMAEKSWPELFEERSHWWSLQPVERPSLPRVKQEE